MLDEVAAAEDVQELEAATDRKCREVTLERGLEQSQLTGIAVHLRRVGRGVAFGAVLRRVDVDPAREDDAVEDVERLVDRLLARRHDERAPSGLLDRLDVVERHERGGQLPRTPARGLCVGGDADHRSAGAGMATRYRRQAAIRQDGRRFAALVRRSASPLRRPDPDL